MDLLQHALGDLDGVHGLVLLVDLADELERLLLDCGLVDVEDAIKGVVRLLQHFLSLFLGCRILCLSPCLSPPREPLLQRRVLACALLV